MDEKRKKRNVISGPGAADFIAAPGGLDTPESGAKGTANTRDESLIDLDDTEPDVAEELDKDGKRSSKL
jgi:hypothetical protein